MIIETTENRFFDVCETDDSDLGHAVWFGLEMERVDGAWAPKANAHLLLVSKADARVVEV